MCESIRAQQILFHKLTIVGYGKQLHFSSFTPMKYLEQEVTSSRCAKDHEKKKRSHAFSLRYFDLA